MYSYTEPKYSFMRYARTRVSGNIYTSMPKMPSDNISMEKYVTYSPDGLPDDNKSIKSDRSDSLALRDPDLVDLSVDKQNSGTTLTLTTLSPAPTTSSLTSDKWRSYWTRRERCCCFWNFLLTVALAVIITLIVLSSKGVIDVFKFMNENENGLSENFEQSSVLTSSTKQSICTTTTPAPPEVGRTSSLFL